mmetsp:Transcript_13214/g.43137  ORF Transcript_13214/g.43137 Transcript_13214/m.43137 type:complete len:546 (+) Transcript_13214:121-1758(+)
MNLAARLEELTPASSQRRASFIATSAYGDVLALSQNNVLHYTHSSLRDLRPILVDGNAFKLATLTTIRFNASAEAVLVAGPNILCTVLPPPRGRDGALCRRAAWNSSVLIDQACSVNSSLVDAIFPAQFDDYICTLDANGVLCFWDVGSSKATTIITRIQCARAFCFGSARWGRFNIFAVTSNHLATICPVAPRRCCISRSEVTKLRRACTGTFKSGDHALAAIKWLDTTFPKICNNEVKFNEKAAWVAADEHRYMGGGVLSCGLAPIEAHLGAPIEICALEAPANVLILATENGRVHVILVEEENLSPVWSSAPASLKLHIVESLVMLDVEDRIFPRLEVRNSEIYYVHNFGVASINVCWPRHLRTRVNGGFNLNTLVAKQPSLCRHVVLASDTVSRMVGAAIHRNSAFGSHTLLCWFGDGSCSAFDMAAYRFAQTQLSSFEEMKPGVLDLHLTSEFSNELDCSREVLHRTSMQRCVATSIHDALSELNTTCEAIEKDAILRFRHLARCSNAMTAVLKMVQITLNRQLRANRITLVAIKRRKVL